MGHPIAIFLSTPDSNFKCAICLDVFNDPVSLTQCGHTFCRECLNSCIVQCCQKDGPSCPECRAKISSKAKANTALPVRVLSSAIGNQIVKCKNAFFGHECEKEYCHVECPWTGKLADWHIHVATDCPIEVIKCPIIGCPHKCPRSQMKSHVGTSQCIEAAMQQRVNDELKSNRLELENQKLCFKEQISKLEREWHDLESRLKRESDDRRVLEEENLILRQKLESRAEKKQLTKLRKEKIELIEQIGILKDRIRAESAIRIEMQVALECYENDRLEMEKENSLLREMRDATKRERNPAFSCASSVKKRRKRKRVRSDGGSRKRTVSTDGNDE